MACEYCDWKDKPNPFFYHGIKFPAAYVDGALLAIEFWEKQRLFSEPKRERLTSPINYCPMCGRDLRDDAE